jgi:hypothetical protein
VSEVRRALPCRALHPANATYRGCTRQCEGSSTAETLSRAHLGPTKVQFAPLEGSCSADYVTVNFVAMRSSLVHFISQLFLVMRPLAVQSRHDARMSSHRTLRECGFTWLYCLPSELYRTFVRRTCTAQLVASLWATAMLALGCTNEADCENQSCVCLAGADCKFECEAPPCHIECRGDNDECIGACANGECSCGEHSNCDFQCDAPPCHVDCANSTTCSGTCANGTCSCGNDATCAFECSAGPCHVSCGDGSNCLGECANGTCACGRNGNCEFTCTDGNCKTQCPNGAECLLRCGANTAGCQFDECSGGVTQCSDGILACGRDCPAK